MLNASGVGNQSINSRTNATVNGNRSSSTQQRSYHRATLNQSYDQQQNQSHNGHFPLLNISSVSAADTGSKQAHAIYAKPMKPGNGNTSTVANSSLMNGTAVNVNATTTLRPVPVIPVTLGNAPMRAPYVSAGASKINANVPSPIISHHPYHIKHPPISSHHPHITYPYSTQYNHAHTHRKHAGIKEMLVSLVLLCLVSLLLALLSLIFLLKIAPVTASDIREVLRAEQLTIITAEEYVVVYEVTLALCALALSLNLCCLLVCAIQFLFAVKLIKSMRTNKYLQKASVSRVCAVGGFFVSIPVFLTGIILYTFIQFHSTPAIVTSAFIGLGIVFCGCAMVHNVLIWQREKTNAVKERARDAQERQEGFRRNSFHNISAPMAGRLNQSCVCSCAADGMALANYLHSTMTGSPLHVQHNHSNSSGGNPIAAQSPAHLREASGGGSSVSPAATTNMGVNMANGLDLSSVATTTNSPHELSTLV